MSAKTNARNSSATLARSRRIHPLAAESRKALFKQSPDVDACRDRANSGGPTKSVRLAPAPDTCITIWPIRQLGARTAFKSAEKIG